MAQASFDSFIQSVYSGGTAMEYFDNYDAGIKVGEGIDDISVDNIFGGNDNKKINNDSDSDTSDNELESESDSESNSECKCTNDNGIKCECMDNKITSSISLTLSNMNESDKDSDSESDKDSDSESIIDMIEIDINSTKKNKPINGARLNPSEISILLAPYK